jgi:hypothetical protein
LGKPSPGLLALPLDFEIDTEAASAEPNPAKVRAFRDEKEAEAWLREEPPT